MKYIDEFRNKELAVKLLKLIHKDSKKEIRLMEVCGGHTMAINKYRNTFTSSKKPKSY